MTAKQIKIAKRKIAKDYKGYLLSRLRKMELFYHSSLMDYKVFEDPRDYHYAMIYLNKTNWYREKLSRL